MKPQECNKVKFLRDVDALDHIKKRIYDANKKGLKATTYLCSKCGSWHIASQKTFKDREVCLREIGRLNEKLKLLEKNKNKEIAELNERVENQKELIRLLNEKISRLTSV